MSQLDGLGTPAARHTAPGGRPVAATLILVAVLVGLPAGFGAHVVPTMPARTSAHEGAGPVVAPRPSFVGQIAATVDLVANRTIPGDLPPTEQYDPNQALYVASAGAFYVRGTYGTAINVLNATTERVVADISLPYSEVPNPVMTMAEDPLTHQVLATNFNAQNISIINTTTSAVTGSIFVGGSPEGIVFDAAAGEFYVTNGGAANVTAINAKTDRTNGNLPVGSHPGALIVDPTDARLFVASIGNSLAHGNVTVLDTSNGTVVATIAVGIRPLTLAWDAADDQVSVGNFGSSNVSFLHGSTATIVRSQSLGTGWPIGLAYAPLQHELFVANQIANNVTVVNVTAGRTVANLSVGTAPYGAVFDSAVGKVFVPIAGGLQGYISVLRAANPAILRTVITVLNPGSVGVSPVTGTALSVNAGASSVDTNATWIDGPTGKSTGSVPLAMDPVVPTADPYAKGFAVTDYYGSTSVLVDQSDLAVRNTAPVGLLPTASAYDTTTTETYVVNQASGNLTLLGPNQAPVVSIAVGLDPTAIAYDPVNHDLYVPTGFGNVTVVSATTDKSITSILVKSGDVLDGVAYDPRNGAVYVADRTTGALAVLDPTSQAVALTLKVGSAPAAVLADPVNTSVFVADSGSSNLTVVDDATNRSVASLPGADPTYLAYDSASNAIYSTGPYSPDLYAANATTYATEGAPLYLGNIEPGGLAYDSSTGDLLVAVQYGDALLEVATSPATDYQVNFTESGLAPGTTWYVALAGTLQSSSTGAVAFSEPNGSYAFSVSNVSGLAPAPSTGVINVDGANVVRAVHFGAVGAGSYNVLFHETGLAVATIWTVVFNGNPQVSNTSTVSFPAANGTYPYSVNPVPGYAVPTNSSGLVLVNGSDVSRTFVFVPTSGTSALSVALTAAPTRLVLGNATDLLATATGGTPPYGYSYTLPAGCTNADRPSIACTPSSTGTFTITVVATDANGSSARSSVVVTVVASGPSGPGGTGTKSTSGGFVFSLWDWVGGLLIVLAAIAAIAYAVRRRRGAPPSPSPPGPTGPGPGGPGVRGAQ